ncbi:hypothetical protein PQX77_009156 [Marasmius sp. AFHP31]|nr:hypothetical protein PQX77_009156 [Marasmius sp. AFHP31]
MPLPEGPLPRLDDNEITTYFENTFGDFLYLIASLGRTSRADLSDFARHGRLTFGAVINRWESGIPAHFACTPRPKWCFDNYSHNIDVCYSEKVYSRVDFQFHNTHNTRVNLLFSLRLPLEARTRLRAAYLCQSEKVSSLGTSNVPLVLLTDFIDEIGLFVTGNFSRNPTTCFRPAYLFVPPLQAEHINGMYCVAYPLPYPLFYWSWDPEGKTVISEEDCEQAGIPELDVEMGIGSNGVRGEYDLVEGHLRKKNYAVDGKQYAQDHGYPELICGDPHSQRIEVLETTDSNEDLKDSDQHGDSEESDEDKPCPSTPQYTSPSAFLLTNFSVGGAAAHLEDRDILHARNMENSVEETRCVKQQQVRVQETASQVNKSKDVAQKSNPHKHFPVFGSDQSSSSRGTTRVLVDSHHVTSTRLAQPQPPTQAVTVSSPRAHPQKAAQKSPRTNAAAGGIGGKSTPARCSPTYGSSLSKPSQGANSPARDFRDDTSVQTTPAEARGKAVVHNGYPDLHFGTFLKDEMKELVGTGGTNWCTASGIEDVPDHRVPSPSTLSAVNTVNDWEGTTQVHSEEGGSSTATYLVQCFEPDTDNIADIFSQRNVSANPAGSTNEDKWDFLVVEDL